MSMNQEPVQLPDTGQVLNVLGLAVRGWALSLEVFLHRGFGSRYIGPEGLFGMCAMFLYTLCWPPQLVGPMLLYCLAFPGLCLFHRLSMFARTWRHEKTHSKYSGQPLLYRPNRFISEVAFKQFCEPLLCLGLGLYVCRMNPPLGVYWVIGAVFVFFSASEPVIWERQRLRDLNDAVVEQQYLAERFREMNGDSY